MNTEEENNKQEENLAILKGCYFQVQKKLFDSSKLKKIKEELTVENKLAHYITKEPLPPTKTYIETEDIIWIPKYYGMVNLHLLYKDERESYKTAENLKNMKLILNEEERHQVSAYDAIMKDIKHHESSIFSLPPGDGKTEVALKVAESLKLKTCVLVHMDFLAKQWKDRIHKYFDKVKTGTLMNNIYDYKGCDVVVVSIQSLILGKYDYSIMRKFGLTIIDECHHISADEWSKSMNYIHSKYILALSGTVERQDGKEKVLEHFLGPVSYKGIRIYKVPVHVEFNHLTYSEPKWKKLYTGEFNDAAAISSLANIQERNEQIISCLMNYYSTNRQILIFSDRIEQLKNMIALITAREEKKTERKITTSLLIGKMKTKDQEEAKKAQWIFSTYKMSGEALDMPSLSIVCLASPKPNVVQAISRVLRVKHPEHEPIIIDFFEEYYKWPKWFWKRYHFYKKENFVFHWNFDKQAILNKNKRAKIDTNTNTNNTPPITSFFTTSNNTYNNTNKPIFCPFS